MLMVDLPSGKIGISFRHRIFPNPDLIKQVSKRFLNGITDCDIYLFKLQNGVETSDLLCCGAGLCRFPDKFDRAIGRKQALTSALGTRGPERKAVFTRTERFLIWQAYWALLETPTPPKHTLSAVVVNGSKPIPIHVAGSQLDVTGHQITGP